MHRVDVRVLFARFYALRYICIIAVVALFAGSVLMFLSGALHTIEVWQVFFFGRSVIALPGHMSENENRLRWPDSGG